MKLLRARLAPASSHTNPHALCLPVLPFVFPLASFNIISCILLLHDPVVVRSVAVLHVLMSHAHKSASFVL